MSTRALLIQRRMPKERSMLYELRELAEAAGYEVVGEVEQVRVPDSSYNIGKGKVEEIADIIKKKDVEKVIFFNELKPVQAYKLRKKWKVDVIDRYELILEIFAKRAGSKEAKLQIELARLKRELSIIKEWINLAKRGEFPGFMGGGRYAFDAYYKHATSRISKIEEELEKIRKWKNLRFKRRKVSGVYSISLTGYTGAGKTTLFNALTGLNEYVDGKPFATLSTKSRRIKIEGIPVVISDTIGFIDSLPPLLMDAFYTTLGELAYSDLILMVVDISENEEEVKRKIETSLDVLSKLGIFREKVIVVANKIDKELNNLGKKLEIIRRYHSKVIPLSALKRIGFEELKDNILRNLPELSDAIIKVKEGDKIIVSKLEENCHIYSISEYNGYLELLVKGRREWLKTLRGKAGIENVLLLN